MKQHLLLCPRLKRTPRACYMLVLSPLLTKQNLQQALIAQTQITQVVIPQVPVRMSISIVHKSFWQHAPVLLMEQTKTVKKLHIAETRLFRFLPLTPHRIL